MPPYGPPTVCTIWTMGSICCKMSWALDNPCCTFCINLPVPWLRLASSLPLDSMARFQACSNSATLWTFKMAISSAKNTLLSEAKTRNSSWSLSDLFNTALHDLSAENRGRISGRAYKSLAVTHSFFLDWLSSRSISRDVAAWRFGLLLASDTAERTKPFLYLLLRTPPTPDRLELHKLRR